MVVKDFGRFSSVLPVKENGLEKADLNWKIYRWLQGKCCNHRPGYLDHGTLFDKFILLRVDGVHLSENGKRIFIHRFAKMMKKALN